MNISILGCGWLGLPLAQSFINDGHSVHGSTTSQEKISSLEQNGITPYCFSLSPALPSAMVASPFWESEALVLNIPPGRGRDDIIDYHSRQIAAVRDAAAHGTIEHCIFVSSTSVYPSLPGAVSENDAISGKASRASGNALLQAEQLLLNTPEFDTTVVRFGGLYGGDRHPARYMAGKTDLKKGPAPVNLIHRDDCVAIISQLIARKFPGEIFNAVADAHPSRQEYYTTMARKEGLPPPSFTADDAQKNYKTVLNDKLKKALDYQFIHPDLQN